MSAIVVQPPAVPDLLGTSPADLAARIDAPQSTLDEARQRAERIRSGLATYAQMRQDIADAYARRDWVALDYGSWFAYVDGEFGEELRGLSRDERPAAVADLRQQGMSTRQIGAAVGVSHEQVRRDLAQVSRDVTPESASDCAPSAPVEPKTDAPAPSTPEKVTGKDGKSYPAKRPSTSDEKPVKPEDRPGYWSPEDRKTHEAEVARIRDIEAARRQSKTIVTGFLAAVVTVVTGSRYGEKGLVTREMVAELRKAIDLLEREIDDAQ